MRHESKVCETRTAEEGEKMEVEALPPMVSLLRYVVGEVVVEGMRDLQLKMNELSQVRTNLKEDIKDQQSELTNEVKQQVSAATNKIEEVTKPVGEMKRKERDRERVMAQWSARCYCSAAKQPKVA